MTAQPMSAKILLPLSALAACPLAVMAACNKNPGLDEATQPVEQTPQQNSARTVIEAARLGAVVRPDSPQPLIERSTQPKPSDSTLSLNQTTPPLPPTRVPVVNLDEIKSVPLNEIVSRSLAKPLDRRTALAPSLENVQPPTDQPTTAPSGVGSPTALPQIPATANVPELTAVPAPVPVEVPQPQVPGDNMYSDKAHSDSTSSADSSADRDRSREIELSPNINFQLQDQSFYSSVILSDIAPATLSDQSVGSSEIVQKTQIDSLAAQPQATQQKVSFFTSLRDAETPIDSPQSLGEADRSASDRSAHVVLPIAIAPENSTQVFFSDLASVTHTPSEQVAAVQTTAIQTTAVQTDAMQATVAQSVPAQTTAPQPSIIGETYTLGAGDRISINFFNVPEYSGEYQVAADGSVNLPVIGGASLTGLTLQESSNFIASLYQNELAYPRVTVNLTARRPLQVSIIGEVGQPGLYTLNADQNVQVIQAIQMAGGFTQSADLRQVQIRRSFRGSDQTISINAWNLLENGDLAQNLTLQDGDSLYIPAAETVDLAASGRLANSNLATTTSTQLKIALVGEVNHPGSYQLPSASGARATLTQAIQSAGGITPTADVRRVQIQRTTRMGETQMIDVNLWQLLQSGDLNQDLILQDGDTIVLAKAEQLPPAETLQLASTNLSPSAIQVNLLGEVKTPGSIELPSNITLNQAVLQAGGLNSRARRSVQLVRMSSTGIVSRRTIDLDFDQDANTELNPVLQNGDLIVVGRSTVTQIVDGVSNVLEPILRIFSPFQGLFGF
jgi:protein involved in polysaccharide export with SLBB domain